MDGGQDIDETEPVRARLAGVCMGLSLKSTCCQLLMIGQEINFIKDLTDTKNRIELIALTVILINIGSNDISKLACIDKAACESLVSAVVSFTMSEVYLTNNMVMYSEIHHTKCIQSSMRI